MQKPAITSFILKALLSLFSFSSFGQVSDSTNWRLVHHENNIEVFTRESANSALKEIRILCTVKSTMDHMVEFLSDVPLYTDWVYKCDSSVLQKEETPNEFTYYITLDFPFPMDNRDLIVHSEHSIDTITQAYRSHSFTNTAMEYTNDEYIHITEFESTWTISPAPVGMLTIDYQAFSDPGGEIPVWLVNLAIAKGPYETMKRFIELVEAE